MKKTLQCYAFLPLMLIVIFSSCVSSSKFKASEARVGKLQQDSLYSLNQLNNCKAQVKNLNGDKSSLQNENSSLQNDNISVLNDLKALSTKSNVTITDLAKRLKNLQFIIQSQKNVMDTLKNSIADALMNYKTDELSVYVKDGNVYVSMQEKLLFKSGSDVVDPKGIEALKTLANVLNSTKDITVMIEGHTDNVPIKTKQFADNWDLSTARATSILRILTKDDGFDSNRITASGKGQYHPVNTNETVEGRAGNRRTEVILTPNLSDLYKLLYE